MLSKWEERRFSELCDITRGASPRPINDWVSDQGIPWVKISDANSSGSRFITRTAECIKPEGRKRSVAVHPGDLILSNSATPGIPKFMGIDACIHDGWLLLRDFRDIDKLFAYYLLMHDRQKLVSQGNGSVFINLKTQILKNHRVRIPPVPEQRAIAHILGTLDDKIELNRRMNETLESMARALFKSWFVDFDPVRAKAEGRWRRGESLPGLPAHLFDLFPDSFEDSELGEIPKGWEVKSFASTVDVLGGGTPKTAVEEYWNGDIPWFSVVDAPTCSDVWAIDTQKKVTRAGVKNSSTRVLPVGTTILSARGTVGRIALVGLPMAMNQSCYGLKGLLGTRGFYCYFTTRELVVQLQQHAHGSVFDTITRDTLDSVHVAAPNGSLVEQFERQVSPSFERILSAVLESRTLAALRDALLPKLIAGQLRVKDAERSADTGTK
ncbi:MAG TPA: restriction endonuclease subunit S [Candidatus Fermentibacter daniensis]|nr:restriction endonuclease subunit S [Candidatus Fermentibacter daniensis]HOR07088.1 restriction endonuclease subunit S [Candidatus Fermentibacter daniensis]HPK52297.1 restriction endonuclease subunit S [Candidatus Fermentibacter daniensis]